MFAVVTTVKVREGSVDELASSFDATNGQLVTGHEDWLGAWFTANRTTCEVTVIAQWRDATSYEALRHSEEFQTTMAQFAQDFDGPPKVSVNEILVQM